MDEGLDLWDARFRLESVVFLEDVHSVTIKIIKYTVFGPEEFPYFYLSPADKEAPEIPNNKLPYHTKNTCKRMYVVLGLLLESTDFFIPGV